MPHTNGTMCFNTDHFKIGDLIEFKRKLGYSHWGVYAGNQEIIHLTCDLSDCDGPIGILKRFLSKSDVKCDKLKDVAGTCEVIVNNFLDGELKANVKETVKCAKDCFGKKGYSILFGNCETFVTMCRYGDPISLQAVGLVKILFALDVGIAVQKLTKSFLEEKIEYFGATATGAIAGTAGIAAAGVTFCLSMTVEFLKELMITLVKEVSKRVLLNFGWAAASNLLLSLQIGFIVYTLYQVVTSETFKKIFSWTRKSFSEFLARLYNLVLRTVSRFRSKPR